MEKKVISNFDEQFVQLALTQNEQQKIKGGDGENEDSVIIDSVDL